jgi:glutamyl-tRNA reductase
VRGVEAADIVGEIEQANLDVQLLDPTAARTPLLTVADVEQAMARRNGRPLVIVDLSLPRRPATLLRSVR